MIFDETSASGHQVSKVLPSNKQHVLAAQDRHDRHVHHEHIQEKVELQKNSNFIPLEQKDPELEGTAASKQEQAFPLGNPFIAPMLKARPEFFPPLQYPPLFKTKPHRLEGSFGPALPPKPEPDVILFPDEELPGVQREVRREDAGFQPINNQACDPYSEF